MRTLNSIGVAKNLEFSPVTEQRYLELFGAPASMLAARTREGSAEAILVASGWRGEGTTTITLGLALTLHLRYGARVLVVEMNFSRPVFAPLFNITDNRSWEEIAGGHASLFDACTPISDGLFVLPGCHASPALRRAVPQALKHIVQEANGKFDVVLIDTPPVLEGGDAVIAGKVVPHLLLVVEAGHASIESLARVRAVLDGQGVAVIGSILNKSRSYMPKWLYRRLNK